MSHITICLPQDCPEHVFDGDSPCIRCGCSKREAINAGHQAIWGSLKEHQTPEYRAPCMAPNNPVRYSAPSPAFRAEAESLAAELRARAAAECERLVVEDIKRKMEAHAKGRCTVLWSPPTATLVPMEERAQRHGVAGDMLERGRFNLPMPVDADKGATSRVKAFDPRARIMLAVDDPNGDDVA